MQRQQMECIHLASLYLSKYKRKAEKIKNIQNSILTKITLFNNARGQLMLPTACAGFNGNYCVKIKKLTVIFFFYFDSR